MGKVQRTKVAIGSGEINGECLYLSKCCCGEEFKDWEFVISIYEENAEACPFCGRKYIFKNTITVYEVTER